MLGVLKADSSNHEGTSCCACQFKRTNRLACQIILNILCSKHFPGIKTLLKKKEKERKWGGNIDLVLYPLEALPWLVLLLGSEPMGCQCLGRKKTQPSQCYHSGQFSQYDEHIHWCCLGGQSWSHVVHLGCPDHGQLQRLQQEQDICQIGSQREPSLAPFAHGPCRS